MIIDYIHGYMCHVKDLKNQHLAEKDPKRKELLLHFFNAAQAFARMLADESTPRVLEFDSDESMQVVQDEPLSEAKNMVVVDGNGEFRSDHVEDYVKTAFSRLSSFRSTLRAIFKKETRVLSSHKENKALAKKIQVAFCEAFASNFIVVAYKFPSQLVFPLLRTVADFAFLQEKRLVREDKDPTFWMKTFLLACMKKIDKLDVAEAPPRPASPEEPNPILPIMAQWDYRLVPKWLDNFFERINGDQENDLCDYPWFEVGGYVKKFMEIAGFTMRETLYILIIFEERIASLKKAGSGEEEEEEHEEIPESNVEMMGSEETVMNVEVKLDEENGPVDDNNPVENQPSMDDLEREYYALCHRLRTNTQRPHLQWMLGQLREAYVEWLQTVNERLRPVSEELRKSGIADSFLIFLRTYSMNYQPGVSHREHDIDFKSLRERYSMAGKTLLQEITKKIDAWSHTYLAATFSWNDIRFPLTPKTLADALAASSSIPISTPNVPQPAQPTSSNGATLNVPYPPPHPAVHPAIQNNHVFANLAVPILNTDVLPPVARSLSTLPRLATLKIPVLDHRAIFSQQESSYATVELSGLVNAIHTSQAVDQTVINHLLRYLAQPLHTLIPPQLATARNAQRAPEAGVGSFQANPVNQPPQ